MRFPIRRSAQACRADAGFLSYYLLSPTQVVCITDPWGWLANAARLLGKMLVARLRQWARTLKRDVIALYLAIRDPRVPWYAKAVAACVAAYALSPIDLIPDFIPVLGYLDELVVLPLGILLAAKLVPQEIMAELRAEAEGKRGERPVSRVGAAVIIGIWIVAVLAAVYWLAGLVWS